MMALEAASSPPQPQQQQQGTYGNGSESLLANVLVGNSGLHTTTTSKASSTLSLGKGTSKKKTQSKSSKHYGSSNSSSSSNNNNSTTHAGSAIQERKDEEIYLENFVKSIEYLPTEIRKDLGTIKELDKKTSKNVTLSTELASDSSKSNADRSEAIRKLMDESINLSTEKVDISQRTLNKIILHMEDLEKKIEELSQNIQQKPQNTLKLESLYIPQLSEDNQVHYFTPSDPSLQSSSSKSNKRLVQHSENLKTLKSGSLKSYPEKEMHAHVFNHTPEQEGIVRGNSTTTRSYASSSSSTKKATEKEPPSQITVKTSTGSVISVPNDRIGNADITLASISSEQKIKKQKKTSKPENAPVNLTPLSINTTNTTISSSSTNGSRKEKYSTSSIPKENTLASSEISSIKIPKKDSSHTSSSAASSSNNSHTTTQSSTKKSRSAASSSSSGSTSNVGSSSSASTTTAASAATSTSGEQSKSGKKRKAIASSTTSGKTKKQKQSSAASSSSISTSVAATPSISDQQAIPSAADAAGSDENTLIYEENLQDPTPYCYCKKTMAEDSSEMVGCDSPKCPNNGWIHKHCLHPGEDPDAPQFYCLNCSKTMSKKKKKK
ncbi:predicted protein [Naegleria gruberi]|uniref:Predicted protein n=1 Tax=Naegleria gruberi TaxID=5762 RepID=D2W1E2_NAEGR|nr:uncharacterized protein NAEGRDRAFT_75185 [Naegleria gruberi]EFC37032.1 predicted protein [Naegleria gruberi]|eukprot:XP_002669776.1 predicted protein [Naegleria gruberi strain NEG-M]